MTGADWADVVEIYADGIATGHATFETEVPSWPQFIEGKAPELRLVTMDGAGRLVGWATAGPVSNRRVYAGVAEHSVYVARWARGRGVGQHTLAALVSASELAGFWTLQTRIFPENTASLALHARCGFREVGRQERLGCHRGWWRDVVLLERRSNRVGT